MVKRFSADHYADRILAQDRVMLSQAITLMESALPSDQELAQQVISRILPHTGNSIRIGITGSPGVGKSSFIEAFGQYLIQKQHKKVAVLAVDPSSQRSGGSILGDKTRMTALATNPAAYIRPSPAGKSLGGVTRHTREAILLCEAAGFDIIIIETVGVGQSETTVNSMVDFFLLLLLAGAGDELQGIKRGIMEMANALAITKADGANLVKARLARAEFQNALHLFPAPNSGWVPQAMVCSAMDCTGIADIWQLVQEYIHTTQKNEYFYQKRRDQNLHWMHETIRVALEDRFYNANAVKAQLPSLEKEVSAGTKSPFLAAQELLNFS